MGRERSWTAGLSSEKGFLTASLAWHTLQNSNLLEKQKTNGLPGLVTPARQGREMLLRKVKAKLHVAFKPRKRKLKKE